MSESSFTSPPPLDHPPPFTIPNISTNTTSPKSPSPTRKHEMVDPMPSSHKNNANKRNDENISVQDESDTAILSGMVRKESVPISLLRTSFGDNELQTLRICDSRGFYHDEVPDSLPEKVREELLGVSRRSPEPLAPSAGDTRVSPVGGTSAASRASLQVDQSTEHGESLISTDSQHAEAAPASQEELRLRRKYHLKPRVKKIWEKFTPYPKVSFEGSVLRDALAEERTYLAWVRTSLACLAIGLAIPKLFADPASAPNSGTKNWILKVMGLLFVLLGAMALIYSTIRFFYARRMLVKNRLIYDRYASIVILLCGIAGASGCMVIIFL